MSATQKALDQFHQFKAKHPDFVLFFRIGDFYETFHDDAKLINRVLGVHLTTATVGLSREQIPLAGVPFHAVEQYLRRMIAAGHKCALCEQVAQEPSKLS